ncbi:MAG: hypothetical protein KDA52_02245 [Planctomycetaceae bacterium]|nr:hypothetical protein [Planctomycetaceae bacterium]
MVDATRMASTHWQGRFDLRHLLLRGFIYANLQLTFIIRLLVHFQDRFDTGDDPPPT